MNSREEILYLIESETFPLVNYKEHFINANNGLLNKEHVERVKKSVLKDSIEYLTDELIKTKQHYPIEDISKVEMELDAVVIKRKDLVKIMKYIETHE